MGTRHVPEQARRMELHPKQKRMKLTKIDKVEIASNDILDKLLQAQKEQKRAADMEWGKEV